LEPSKSILTHFPVLSAVNYLTGLKVTCRNVVGEFRTQLALKRRTGFVRLDRDNLTRTGGSAVLIPNTQVNFRWEVLSIIKFHFKGRLSLMAIRSMGNAASQDLKSAVLLTFLALD